VKPPGAIPARRALLLWGALSLLALGGLVVPALGGLALLADLLLLGLVLYDVRQAARIPLVVRREPPAVLHQGEATALPLVVENPSGAAVSLVMREVLHPNLIEAPVDHAMTLPAASRAQLSTPLRPRIRGDADLAPVALRVLGPWGLGWAGRFAEEGQALRVHPRVHFEGETGLRLKAALQLRAGAHPQERRGLSTELYGLREYQPGDPMRSVHWKASARRGAPVTRETCWEQHQHIVVLLDAGRPMAAQSEGNSRLDHALAAVLALLRVAVAHQDDATLLLFSQTVRQVVRVDRHTRAFAEVYGRLYAEQPDADEPDYAEAVAWCGRLPRRSLVILLSSVQDGLGADRLQAALGHLSRRHKALLVHLEDPGVTSLARSEPATAEEAFAKIGALSALTRADTLAQRLRAAGIDTLSTSAGGLTLGLLDRYFAFKGARRG